MSPRRLTLCTHPAKASGTLGKQPGEVEAQSLEQGPQGVTEGVADVPGYQRVLADGDDGDEAGTTLLAAPARPVPLAAALAPPVLQLRLGARAPSGLSGGRRGGGGCRGCGGCGHQCSRRGGGG